MTTNKDQVYEWRLHIKDTDTGHVLASLTFSSDCILVSVSGPDSTFISGI